MTINNPSLYYENNLTLYLPIAGNNGFIADL